MNRSTIALKRGPIIARRKQIEQHHRRTQEIVDASAHLIQEKGFHGTTLQDVADQLDFTKAALYYYVQDKQDLLFRIHMQTLEMALVAVESIVQGATSPREKVRACLDNQVRMVARHPDLFTVYFHEKSHLTVEHTEAVTTMERRIVHAIVDVIRAGIAGGDFQDVDPTVAAFAVLGASSWVYRWYRPGGRLAIEEVSQTLQTMILSGLEKRGD
ncbi:MAG: TetR/AcrR family transcriptional regulator [Ktedonobacteraceae bacterium]